MKKRAQRVQARLPDISLAVLVVGSALAIGAVHVVSGAVVALLASAFALTAAAEASRNRRRVRIPVLAWAAALAGVWCLVQTLPLGGLVDSLSPAVAGLWSHAEGAHAHLSGNLEGTRSAGLRYLLGALLLVGSVVWFGQPDRVRGLVDLLIISASVVAVIGFVQSWLQADDILFVYQPRMGPVREGVHGPFVNPDHFGAYTAVGALLAISRGALMQVHRRRFLDYALGALLLAATFVSLSVSAALGLLVGLGWLTAVWWRRDRKLGDLLGVAVGIAVAAVFFTLVATSLNVTPSPGTALSDQLSEAPQMVEIWSEAWRLGLSAPLVGIGSGTLPDLLGLGSEGPAASTWFARNQPLQTLVDLGWVVGPALLLAVLALLRRAVTRWPLDHLPTVLPVVVALVGLLTTSLLDFLLEIPAIGIVAALLAGAMYAQARRLAGDNDQELRWRGHAIGRRSIVPVTALLVGLTLFSAGWSLATGRRSRDALVQVEAIAFGRGEVAEQPLEALETAARERLAVRPGQARVYAVVGLGFLAHDEPERALLWLRTAVALRPGDSNAYELLALTELRLQNWAGALAEFERAIAADPALIREIMALVIRETDDEEVWLGITPDNERRRLLVTELLAADRAVDALRYASALLDAEPENAAAFESGARAAFDLGIHDLAEYYAENLARVDPDSLRAEIIQARLELRRGELDAASERIQRVLAEAPDDYLAWYAMGEILLQRVESGAAPDDVTEPMREVRARLRPTALSNPDRSVEFYRLSARFYLAIGNWRAAASASGQGIEAGGEHADLYALRGLALYELRDVAGAAAALRRAIELGSADPRVVDSLTRIAAGDADRIE